MRDTCATCRFWEAAEDGAGYCLRYPPVIVASLLPAYRLGAGAVSDLQLHDASLHPITNMHAWCGEHQRRCSASGVPLTIAPPGAVARIGEVGHA